VPIGELAALATAVAWCFTSLFFAEAARRIGSVRVNLLRLPAGLALQSLLLLVLHRPLVGLTTGRVALLGVSAVLGLVVGDLAFFGALRRLGPRLSLLLLSLAPIFASLTAWPLLHERLGFRALAGIAVTLAGVAWVVLERGAGERTSETGRGVALGIVAAVCQGVGLVLAKLGMAGEVLPLAAAWTRLLVATLVIWLALALARRLRVADLAAAVRTAGRPVLGGAFFGPFLGMWLSLVAAAYADVGVAATIMATNPVLVIPLVMRTEGYRPSARALVGTAVTVAGVALLFWR
jgi:drug/metabolite transporter (DMT)-like permease